MTSLFPFSVLNFAGIGAKVQTETGLGKILWLGRVGLDYSPYKMNRRI